MPKLAVCIRMNRRPLCLARVPGVLRLADGPRLAVETAAVILSYKLDRILSEYGAHTADTALYFLGDGHTWNPKDHIRDIRAAYTGRISRRLKAGTITRIIAAAAAAAIGTASPAASASTLEQAKDLSSRTFAESFGRGAFSPEPVPAGPMTRRDDGGALLKSAAQVAIAGRMEPPFPGTTGARGFSDGFAEGFAAAMKPAIKLYVEGFVPVRGTWVPSPYYFLTTAAAAAVGLVLSPIAAVVGLARGLFAAVAEN